MGAVITTTIPKISFSITEKKIEMDRFISTERLRKKSYLILKCKDGGDLSVATIIYKVLELFAFLYGNGELCGFLSKMKDEVDLKKLRSFYRKTKQKDQRFDLFSKEQQKLLVFSLGDIL